MGLISVSNGNRTFDYSENGTAISFEQAWSHFKMKDSSEFLSIPIFMVLSMLLFIFTFHVIAIALLHKLTKASFEKGEAKHSLIFNHIIEGLHSFLTPSLHLDWEELFTISNRKHPIRVCWRRYFTISTKSFTF